jgi:hypothetical protein
MSHNVLHIAARAPRPGFAKSRLGRTIGHLAAVELYAAFLRDLASRFNSTPFPVGWYITPDDAWPELAPLVAGVGPRGPVTVQCEGSAVHASAANAGPSWSHRTHHT